MQKDIDILEENIHFKCFGIIDLISFLLLSSNIL